MRLLDQLRKAPKKPGLRGQGRRAFLAKRDEIAEALEAGFSAKEVWQHMHDVGDMPVQYRQFARYVESLIYGKAKPGQSRPAENLNTNAEPLDITQPKANQTSLSHYQEDSVGDEVGCPKKLSDSVSRRFEYDPMGKGLEDLI